MGLQLLGPGGPLDRGNVPYGDSNPPQSLMRTVAAEPPNPPSGQTDEWYDSSGILWVKDSTGSKQILTGGHLTKRVATAQTNSSTTRADVTDLLVALGTGTWGYEWFGTYTCSATTVAPRIAINFTGTAAVFNGHVNLWTANTGSYGAALTALDTSPSPGVVGAANTELPYALRGSLVVTAAGNFACRFAPSTVGSMVIARGSILRLFRLPGT